MKTADQVLYRLREIARELESLFSETDEVKKEDQARVDALTAEHDQLEEELEKLDPDKSLWYRFTGGSSFDYHLFMD